MRLLFLFVASMILIAQASPSERACDTGWVERDFLVVAAGNADLERLARVEARIVNAEGKPEEAGGYLLVRHLPGPEASFYFAVGESFHTLKAGQSKRLFIEAAWRTGPKGGVLLKTCYCR
jgi:hypothetical protein